jgi:hypothetical protein
MINGIQSKIKIYWRVWLAATILLFVLRFTIFLHATENTIFILFTIYAIPTWIAIMILNFYEGHILLGYLEKNHREKWEHLTTFWGSRGYNGFRYLPFIFSKEDLGDQILSDHKKYYRKLIDLSITVFLSYPVIFLAIMLPLKSLASAS